MGIQTIWICTWNSPVTTKTFSSYAYMITESKISNNGTTTFSYTIETTVKYTILSGGVLAFRATTVDSRQGSTRVWEGLMRIPENIETCAEWEDCLLYSLVPPGPVSEYMYPDGFRSPYTAVSERDDLVLIYYDHDERWRRVDTDEYMPLRIEVRYTSGDWDVSELDFNNLEEVLETIQKLPGTEEASIETGYTHVRRGVRGLNVMYVLSPEELRKIYDPTLEEVDFWADSIRNLDLFGIEKYRKT